MAKRRKLSPPKTKSRLLSQKHIRIRKEARYIISRAKAGDPRVVTLGPLVFFSTETGDAWVLDPEDGLALCLARDREEQPFTITETATAFQIEWSAEYRLEGDTFIVLEPPDRIKSIFGYPTGEILQAVRRAK
jgi:hypothetical protein